MISPIIPSSNIFKVYFIDTEFDEDDNTYDEKSQDTIDIMLKEHKRNQDKVKKKVLINKEEKTC